MFWVGAEAAEVEKLEREAWLNLGLEESVSTLGILPAGTAMEKPAEVRTFFKQSSCSWKDMMTSLRPALAAFSLRTVLKKVEMRLTLSVRVEATLQ